MTLSHTSLARIGLLTALLAPFMAHATNGYFSHGYGAKALGIGAPSRSASINGNAFGADASFSGDDTSTFFIPEFGYTRRINVNTSIGIAVYGNGGMNTDYGSNPFSRFGGTGSAGVNLEQLFISPSVAYQLNDSHTVGVAINIAYQRFEAKGVGFFSGFSAAPASVSNQGVDSSAGAGVRLGWTGKVAPTVTWQLRHSRKLRHRDCGRGESAMDIGC